MVVSVWTHPEHSRVALLATLLNITSLLFCILAFMVITWFSSSRYGETKEYTMLEFNVDCTGDVCIPVAQGSPSDWQKTAFNLILAGLVNNGFTAGVLVIVFWPMVVFKQKVFNALLITCRVLDFVGAYFKVAGACIYLSHSHQISKHYVKRTQPQILRLEFEPLAFLLVSFLAEMVSFVLLVVATDQAPRTGGPTHRERLELDAPVKETEEDPQPERRVSYIPETKESHMRVLSQLQMDKTIRLSIQSEGTLI